MTDEQLNAMILDLAMELDYDIGKSLKPNTSEEPEEIPYRMRRLRFIAKHHLNAKPDGGK